MIEKEKSKNVNILKKLMGEDELEVSPKATIVVTKEKGRPPRPTKPRGIALGGIRFSKESMKKSLEGKTIKEKLMNAIK